MHFIPILPQKGNFPSNYVEVLEGWTFWNIDFWSSTFTIFLSVGRPCKRKVAAANALLIGGRGCRRFFVAWIFIGRSNDRVVRLPFVSFFLHFSQILQIFFSAAFIAIIFRWRIFFENLCCKVGTLARLCDLSSLHPSIHSCRIVYNYDTNCIL